ncbi:MAG: CpsD/CapB family tyrosine-protein kinase, partial [Candidatus Izemoplasmataceae bacterium]
MIFSKLVENYKKQENYNYKIVSSEEPSCAVTEQYRKLRTNIDYSTFNHDLKVINLTSAFPGEGKTISALNLATVYSQSELKTLIIDMDLRKPKIHRAFNISNAVGLSQLVTKNVEKDKAIFKICDYLDVIPAGEKLPFPAEFLLSKKLLALVESLKQDYDKIIIDCPPMTAVADANIISKFSDGTIIVVASRKTASNVVEDIMNSLK